MRSLPVLPVKFLIMEFFCNLLRLDLIEISKINITYYPNRIYYNLIHGFNFPEIPIRIIVDSRGVFSKIMIKSKSSDGSNIRTNKWLIAV